MHGLMWCKTCREITTHSSKNNPKCPFGRVQYRCIKCGTRRLEPSPQKELSLELTPRSSKLYKNIREGGVRDEIDN